MNRYKGQSIVSLDNMDQQEENRLFLFLREVTWYFNTELSMTACKPNCNQRRGNPKITLWAHRWIMKLAFSAVETLGGEVGGWGGGRLLLKCVQEHRKTSDWYATASVGAMRLMYEPRRTRAKETTQLLSNNTWQVGLRSLWFCIAVAYFVSINLIIADSVMFQSYLHYRYFTSW